ncbi:fasciclin domain-containing protein [Hyunsoonleella flava]|uniref:fasciclin domain-containing protein n=1 Tax=Hyunsoonleella flava TaxID=2527939 RepID=UPI00293951F5|nr:fasciclin domain-containing protein [Hyunsoonleella flava]
MDSNTLNSLLKPENKKALTNILTYHVVAGKLDAEAVVAALDKNKGMVTLEALNGQKLTVKQKDGKIWLKDQNGNYSEIIMTDVMGSNGVIHVINSVVMPK